VVVTVALLSAVFGSVSVAMTDAVFVTGPDEVGLTTIVMVSLSLGARLANVQVTDESHDPPPEAFEETKVVPVGTGSLTVTLSAE
jgi:hypothetical protein